MQMYIWTSLAYMTMDTSFRVKLSVNVLELQCVSDAKQFTLSASPLSGTRGSECITLST